MLKKIFILVMILAMSGVVSASESIYPKHLNADKDFVLAWGHTGVGTYVKKSSINVKRYAPPIYIISARAYLGNEDGKILGNYYATFKYDYDGRQMYIEMDSGDWKVLYPQYTDAINAESRAFGEMVFYIAYRIPFFGSAGGFNENFYSAAD